MGYFKLGELKKIKRRKSNSSSSPSRQPSYSMDLALVEVSQTYGVCRELFEYFEYYLTKKQIRDAKMWVRNWKPIAEA